MAKLIALLADTGGKIWINPDAVSSVIQYDEGKVQLRMLGEHHTVYLAGDADAVAAKLNSVRQREPV